MFLPRPLSLITRALLLGALLLLAAAVPAPAADQPAPATDGREALLLIGIQDSRFPGGEIDPARAAARQAGRVLQEFRKAGELVLHVGYTGAAEDPFTHEVQPEGGEAVLTAGHPNPFLETRLLTLLREQGVTRLVVCGLQAHLEVEAAVRAAADLGFQCTVISDACHSGDLRWRGRTMAGDDLLLGTMLTLRRHYARVQSIDGWLAAH